MADDVAGRGADGIDTAIFLDEAEAGQTEFVDLTLLPRRQLAPDGHKSPSLLQPLAQLRGVDVREHACDLLDQLVPIDHPRRVRIEGSSLDVGGEQPAVAV